MWFSEHSPSSLALQNSAAFPLKIWLCQVGRAPQPSAPHHPDDRSFQHVSRCHEEAETVILLLLPDEARNMSILGVPGYVLWTGILSVERNNVCSCLGDIFLFLWCSHFFNPLLLLLPNFPWQLHTLGTSRSC